MKEIVRLTIQIQLLHYMSYEDVRVLHVTGVVTTSVHKGDNWVDGMRRHSIRSPDDVLRGFLESPCNVRIDGSIFFPAQNDTIEAYAILHAYLIHSTTRFIHSATRL